MIFHLVWNKRCDNYIAFRLKESNVADVFDVVHLGSILQTSISAEKFSDEFSTSNYVEFSIQKKQLILHCAYYGQ
jgi:hypothetical protein